MSHIAVAFMLHSLMEERKRHKRKNWVRSMKIGRMFRGSEDLMRCSDSDFLKNYGISKSVAQEVIHKLEPLMVVRRKGALSAKFRILTTLRLLGMGGYQMIAGAHSTLRMTQASVSRSIREVVPLILTLSNEVLFPKTEAEKSQIAKGFERLGPFDMLLGVVGCTQIKVPRICQNDCDFRNHVKYHYLNVEMLCDSNLRILSVNPKYPGIAENELSWLSGMMIDIHSAIKSPYALLGDSYYAYERFVLTPAPHPVPNSPEERYTEAHNKVRNSINQAFTCLKARFPILERMKYDPTLATKIVCACVILHNMSIRHGDPEPSAERIANLSTLTLENNNGDHLQNNIENDVSAEFRDAVIRKYFI